MPTKREIYSVATEELRRLESVSRQEFDASHNEIYFADCGNERYVLKFIDNHPLGIRFAKKFQYELYKEGKAPEPVFVCQMDRGVLVCNEYLNLNYPGLSNLSNSKNCERVSRLMGRLLADMHNLSANFDIRGYGRVYNSKETKGVYSSFNELYDTNPEHRLISNEVIKEYQSIIRNNPTVESNEEVICPTDFTKSNVLFDMNLCRSLFVDWEFVERIPPIFSLVGVYFRQIRPYVFPQSHYRDCWNSLRQGYESRINDSVDIPSYGDGIMKKYLAIESLNEISDFTYWNQMMTKHQTSNQIDEVASRADWIESM